MEDKPRRSLHGSTLSVGRKHTTAKPATFLSVHKKSKEGNKLSQPKSQLRKEQASPDLQRRTTEESTSEPKTHKGRPVSNQKPKTHDKESTSIQTVHKRTCVEQSTSKQKTHTHQRHNADDTESSSEPKRCLRSSTFRLQQKMDDQQSTSFGHTGSNPKKRVGRPPSQQRTKLHHTKVTGKPKICGRKTASQEQSKVSHEHPRIKSKQIKNQSSPQPLLKPYHEETTGKPKIYVRKPSPQLQSMEYGEEPASKPQEIKESSLTKGQLKISHVQLPEKSKMYERKRTSMLQAKVANEKSVSKLEETRGYSSTQSFAKRYREEITLKPLTKEELSAWLPIQMQKMQAASHTQQEQIESHRKKLKARRKQPSLQSHSIKEESSSSEETSAAQSTFRNKPSIMKSSFRKESSAAELSFRKEPSAAKSRRKEPSSAQSPCGRESSAAQLSFRKEPSAAKSSGSKEPSFAQLPSRKEPSAAKSSSRIEPSVPKPSRKDPSAPKSSYSKEPSAAQSSSRKIQPTSHPQPTKKEIKTKQSALLELDERRSGESQEDDAFDHAQFLKMSFESQLATATKLAKAYRMDLEEPEHPRYCYCEREIEYSMMVECSNNVCPWEWFHFECVNIEEKPKGKWYCPSCRLNTCTTKKTMTVLLQQLQKYNDVHFQHAA